MSAFDEISSKDYLFEGSHFFLVRDKYPVSPGHLLIISKEDKIDYFHLNEDEKNELQLLILKAREIIEKDHSPDGFNIGMNCGEAAGQTIFHFHCHVIPRYLGDMKDPRGGIRHCIEGKGYY